MRILSFENPETRNIQNSSINVNCNESNAKQALDMKAKNPQLERSKYSLSSALILCTSLDRHRKSDHKNRTTGRRQKPSAQTENLDKKILTTSQINQVLHCTVNNNATHPTSSLERISPACPGQEVVMSPSALQETKELTTNADQSNIERFQNRKTKNKNNKNLFITLQATPGFNTT